MRIDRAIGYIIRFKLYAINHVDSESGLKIFGWCTPTSNFPEYLHSPLSGHFAWRGVALV